MKQQLKVTLEPEYQKLLHEIKKNRQYFSNICTFCAQWGSMFPHEKDNGILFVGKAVNGGKIKNIYNAKTLFNKSYDQGGVFDWEDQMKWVEDIYNKPLNGYKTSSSAFWRVIKKTSIEFYPIDWFAHVAWTNLYKVAPWEGGNPTNRQCDIQYDYCLSILKKEIKILSPKFIVMLTSGWESDFIKKILKKDQTEIEKINWSKYCSKIYSIENKYLITSPHPQGKNEFEHIKAIIGLISKYKNA